MQLEEKFKFTIEFQEDLLKYTLQDRYGYKVVEDYKDSYFSLLDHQIIAYAIKMYFNEHGKVPGITMLKETLREVFNMQMFANTFTIEEEREVIKKVSSLYKDRYQDGDQILDRSKQFKAYVKMKEIVENMDINNFKEYPNFLKKANTIYQESQEREEVQGTYLIKDVKERQFKRQDSGTVFPTPFRQINDLTNAGGYEKGSIIVVLDRPKKFKTGIMINVARGYMKMKKKVLYIDVENGVDGITMRIEQSVASKTKKEILSGKYDEQVQKTLRKYKRLGGETYIRRIPAGSTTDVIQRILDEEYQENGIRFDELIIDYIGLLGAKSGKVDDHNRISDAYLDVMNLALTNGIEHVWTPHHVRRDAYKKESTRYGDDDVAKCTEIGRHIHAMFGLNRNEEEIGAGFMRMELIVQRDGKQDGRAIFKVNNNTQRADELTKAQRREYDNQMGYLVSSHIDDDENQEDMNSTNDI